LTLFHDDSYTLVGALGLPVVGEIAPKAFIFGVTIPVLMYGAGFAGIPFPGGGSPYPRAVLKTGDRLRVAPACTRIGILERSNREESRMHPSVIGVVVLACTFAGVQLGMRLRSRLPDQHLSGDTRDTIKLAIGLVATVTALVLGLLTASAKSNFDAMDANVKRSAAGLLSLDRSLARYGPEAAEIRRQLKEAVAQRVDGVWQGGRSGKGAFDPSHSAQAIEHISTEIHRLAPGTDEQRVLKTRAVAAAESLLDTRWIIVAGTAAPVPVAFLAVLVLWLTVTFTTFAMLAPRSRTMVLVLFVCSLSVSGAIFLVLEMSSPFDGLISVSSAPMDYALSHMNE